MEQRFVLSYDLGTSGVKGALVSLEGMVQKVFTVEYPLYLPAPNRAEQEPEDYWQGVCTATKKVLELTGVAPDAIAGIAFGTQWKGLIPVSQDGKVLHRSVIWMDARAGEEAAMLNDHFHLNCFSASDYWPRLWWMKRHEPEIMEQAVMVLDACSYLKWRATGVAAMDVGNCLVRSFDLESDARYREILDVCGVPQDKFPPLVEAHELVGHVTAKAAAEMGLVAGIPVFGGNSDIGAVAVGAGAADIGGVHAYFGTSGWIGYTEPHENGKLYIASLDKEREIKLCSSSNATGLSFNWAVDRFYTAEKQAMGSDVYAFVDNDVASVPAGSQGVIAAPWFRGFSGDTKARACFINLGSEHDRRHMTRAVLEGVCYQLKLGIEAKHAKANTSYPKSINAVGGGAGSALWMQILADVLNVAIHVPADTRHAGAVGTAYAALIGLGVCSDYTEAAKKVKIDKIYTPDPENVKAYEKSYALFKTLHQSLKHVFKEN